MELWNTIDTAPKDKPIELWRPAPVPGGLTWQSRVYGIWSDEDQAWIWPDSQIAWPDVDDREWIEEGDYYSSNSFTHWREIAPPPTR